MGRTDRDESATEAAGLVRIVLPLLVLLFTRAGIELSVQLLPLNWAWLPAFGVYYLTIGGSIWYASQQWGLAIPAVGRLQPLLPFKLFILGCLLPALLPLGVFVLNVQVVPIPILLSTVGFALINPLFEDAFWRGLLTHLPMSAWGRILVSASLFSFSHYFLWGAYWLSSPRVLLPTCLTTFIMGVCWMWLYQRDGRLIYPIVSHILVDIFNLSIAIFMGVSLPTLSTTP